jgi:hypothetical protein
MNKILPPTMGRFAYGDSRYSIIPEYNAIKKHEMNQELHRTIEPEDITSEYILVCGCSQSMGEGIANTETYSHLLSQNLSVPVYNLSLSGSGCDFIELNIKNWITNFSIKPKLVIVQWSFPNSRMLHFKDGSPYLLGPWVVDNNLRHNLWKKEFELQKCYKDNIDNIYNISLVSRKSLLDFLNTNQINYIEIMLDDYNFIESTIFNTIDRGIDGRHPGPETHRNISDKLTSMIKNDTIFQCNKL